MPDNQARDERAPRPASVAEEMAMSFDEKTLPTRAQLVRFRKRVEKAHDALESASFHLLAALRVYDGDKIPVNFDCAMAWEDVTAAEAAIGVLTRTLAGAETDTEEALKVAP